MHIILPQKYSWYPHTWIHIAPKSSTTGPCTPGTVTVSVHTRPPIRPRASNTVTFHPLAVRLTAACKPAAPAPAVVDGEMMRSWGAAHGHKAMFSGAMIRRIVRHKAIFSAKNVPTNDDHTLVLISVDERQPRQVRSDKQPRMCRNHCLRLVFPLSPATSNTYIIHLHSNTQELDIQYDSKNVSLWKRQTVKNSNTTPSATCVAIQSLLMKTHQC